MSTWDSKENHLLSSKKLLGGNLIAWVIFQQSKISCIDTLTFRETSYRFSNQETHLGYESQRMPYYAKDCHEAGLFLRTKQERIEQQTWWFWKVGLFVASCRFRGVSPGLMRGSWNVYVLHIHVVGAYEGGTPRHLDLDLISPFNMNHTIYRGRN